MDGKMVTTDSKESTSAGDDAEVSGLLEEQRGKDGRKRKKSERARERERERSKKRIRRLTLQHNGDNGAQNMPVIRGKSTYLDFTDKKGCKGKLHFLKGCFDPSSCAELANLLNESSGYWKEKKDLRRASEESSGCRSYFTAGKWCAVGHAREGIDSTYWAKPVGNIATFPNLRLIELLSQFASKASVLLNRYRPDISCLTQDLDNVFGQFHLFFAIRGIVRQHTDPNDAISFVFPLHAEPESKGGLEIGGTSICFSSQPGDAILFDSDVLSHGIPSYVAGPSERMVGIFVVQKTYLRIFGIRA